MWKAYRIHSMLTRGARVPRARGGCLALWLLCLSTLAALHTAREAVSQDGPADAGSDALQEVETWDFSPYHIQAWLTIEPRGALSPEWQSSIERTMFDFALPAAEVTWDLKVDQPPVQLRSLLAHSLETFTAEDILNADLVLAIHKERNKELDLKRVEDITKGEDTTKGNVRIGLGDPTGTRLGQRTLAGLGQQLGRSLYARSDVQRLANSKELVDKVLEDELDAVICYRADTNGKLDKLTLIELRLPGDSRQILEHDKLLFVNVTVDARGYSIQAREMDGTTRHLGPVVEHTVRQPEMLAPLCAVAMTEAFSPIARIEEPRSQDDEQPRRNAIGARVRAGGLIQRPECIAHIDTDDVLLPIVRRNDKYGNPSLLETVPWTFLQVLEREGAILDCDVHSGTRGGMSARRSARTQRIAIKAAPRPAITTIYLQSRDASPRPMIGYEIYAKDLSADDMELIGYSDWRGAFDVPPADDFPLRLLYVKNGGFVMAKLPVVPGLTKELTAQMNDDERRLEAEAFVKSLHTTITDIVMRSKVFEVRIRNQLQEGKIDEADQLLRELQTLPTRDDLARLLGQRQNAITDPNPVTQRKIDLLFKETRDLLTKYIDATLATRLADEVQRARQGG